MTPYEEKFWARFDRSADCWLWTGSLNLDGYGQVSFRGRSTGVHRVAWTLTYGLIPPGLHVLHRCDVRRCGRPDHLWIGTHHDNMMDAIAKGRIPRRLKKSQIRGAQSPAELADLLEISVQRFVQPNPANRTQRDITPPDEHPS